MQRDDAPSVRLSLQVGGCAWNRLQHALRLGRQGRQTYVVPAGVAAAAPPPGPALRCALLDLEPVVAQDGSGSVARFADLGIEDGRNFNRNASTGTSGPLNQVRHHVVAMLLDSKLHTWGSREDLHLLLSKALMAQGAKALLVFSEVASEELRERYRAHGVEVTAINYGLGARHYYRELGRLVREHSVTTVHIAFFTYFSLLPWMARLHGVRWIVYHERNPGVLKAKTWEQLLLRVRTRVVAWPMTRVIMISDYVRRRLIQAGIPASKSTVVLHGIDTVQYRPDSTARERVAAEFGIQPGEIILTALSYLLPHKNIDVILRACKRLEERGVKVRCFVVGHGPAEARLQALSQELGLAGRVHWLGHIPNPVPLLQASDLFLMVSTGEGFGLAVAEAMACGAVPIAARSGALPEIVEDGVSGLLVPERDAVALADSIQMLIQDEGRRRLFAANGIDRVRRLFTAEGSTAGVGRVYESMWAGF